YRAHPPSICSTHDLIVHPTLVGTLLHLLKLHRIASYRDDLHPPPDRAVSAGPVVTRPPAAARTPVRPADRRIVFFVRPGYPVLKIRDLGNYRRWGRGDEGAALDLERRGVLDAARDDGRCTAACHEDGQDRQ